MAVQTGRREFGVISQDNNANYRAEPQTVRAGELKVPSTRAGRVTAEVGTRVWPPWAALRLHPKQRCRGAGCSKTRVTRVCWGRPAEPERQRERQRDTEKSERDRERETERQGETERQTDKDRERQTDTERDREDKIRQQALKVERKDGRTGEREEGGKK